MSKRKKERILAEIAKKRKIKRLFQIVGGISLTGIITTGILTYKALSQKLDTNHNQNYNVTSSLEEITFEEAQRNSKVREKYIDQIVKRCSPPIENLVVEYNGEVDSIYHPMLENKTIMRTYCYVPVHLEGDIQDIKTIIYRGSFTILKSEDEFLSSLVDHEYEHIKIFSGKVVMSVDKSVLQELQNRAFDVDGDLFYVFQELFAFSNQIKSFSKRKNLSDTYKMDAMKTYNDCRKIVKEKSETPLTKWLLEKYPEIK